MHMFSDRLIQSDRAGYRMNHSPFVCRLVQQRTGHIYTSREPDDPIDDSHGPF